MGYLRLLYTFLVIFFAGSIIAPANYAYSTTKRGKATKCLKITEHIKNTCDSAERNNDTRGSFTPEDHIVDEKCTFLTRQKKKICDTPQLRCNNYDMPVCGLTLTCSGEKACPIANQFKTFKNVCSLVKSRAKFEKSGRCAENSTPCIHGGKKICGQPRSTCTDLYCLNAQQLPQWYIDRCELQLAGAYELPSDSCNFN